MPNLAAGERLLLSGLCGDGLRGDFMLCARPTGLPLRISFFGGAAGLPKIEELGGDE